MTGCRFSNHNDQPHRQEPGHYIVGRTSVDSLLHLKLAAIIELHHRHVGENGEISADHSNAFWHCSKMTIVWENSERIIV